MLQKEHTALPDMPAFRIPHSSASQITASVQQGPHNPNILVAEKTVPRTTVRGDPPDSQVA